MPADHPTTSGIYIITCIPTGKFYVGSAVNLRNRWRTHRGALNRGKHHSAFLQRAWRKYGGNSFEWKVIEYVMTEHLIEREQHYIDSLGAAIRGRGFNISPTAGSCLGVKLSDETKAKLKIAARNRSPEVRAKIGLSHRGMKKPAVSEANRNRNWKDESKAKMSEASRKQKHTAERRAKVAKANSERKWTEDSKHKMSLIKRNPSPEARASVAEANRKRIWTSEGRSKISASLAGNSRARKNRPLPDQGEFDF